jgi:multicomponent Na+:H+ antiporter subunit G
MLLAAALVFGETGVALKGAVTVCFIFLTAPVAANLLARAAYARKTPLWGRSIMDEGRGKISAPDSIASLTSSKSSRKSAARKKTGPYRNKI